MKKKRLKAAHIPGLLVDGLCTFGWLMFSLGCGLIYLPAGFIACGALAIAAGALIGRRLNS